jgi:hypothetical protein
MKRTRPRYIPPEPPPPPPATLPTTPEERARLRAYAEDMRGLRGLDGRLILRLLNEIERLSGQGSPCAAREG